MTINPNFNLLAIKIKISTLWVMVFFNMIFRDLHEFLRTGYLDELLAMTSNGAQVSQGLLLAAAIVLEVPILMIFLTQVLEVKISRWANMATAVFILIAIVSNNLTPDLDDLFFYSFACGALLLIVWYAWRWSSDS